MDAVFQFITGDWFQELIIRAAILGTLIFLNWLYEHKISLEPKGYNILNVIVLSFVHCVYQIVIESRLFPKFFGNQWEPSYAILLIKLLCLGSITVFIVLHMSKLKNEQDDFIRERLREIMRRTPPVDIDLFDALVKVCSHVVSLNLIWYKNSSKSSEPRMIIDLLQKEPLAGIFRSDNLTQDDFLLTANIRNTNRRLLYFILGAAIIISSMPLHSLR